MDNLAKYLTFNIGFGVNKSQIINSNIINSDDFLKTLPHIVEIIKEVSKNISDENIEIFFDYSCEGSFLQKVIICATCTTLFGLSISLPFALTGNPIIEANIKDNNLFNFSFLNNNKKIINNRSKIYQNLNNEDYIYYETEYNNKNIKEKVDKTEFQNLIINELTNNEEIQILKIKVISPYLGKQTNKKWKGEYLGNIFDFKVKDKIFLEKLQNGNIIFSSQPLLIGKFKIRIYKDFDDNCVKSEYELLEVELFGDYKKDIDLLDYINN